MFVNTSSVGSGVSRTIVTRREFAITMIKNVSRSSIV